MPDGWGLVMYKTFYNEDVDSQWPTFISRFNAYVLHGMSLEVGPVPQDQMQRAIENLRYPVFVDRELFEDKSPDDLRGHFLQWLADNNRSTADMDARSRVFIAVNESDFRSVLALPENPNGAEDSAYEEMVNHRVTLVDGMYDPEHTSYEEKYVGWVRLNPSSLYLLTVMSELRELHEMYPNNTDGDGVPVWTDDDYGVQV